MFPVLLLWIIFCRGDILKDDRYELKSWIKTNGVNQINITETLMQHNVSTLKQLQSLNNCNRNQLQQMWKIASNTLYQNFLHSLNTYETQSTEAASFTDAASNEIIRKLEQQKEQNISELNQFLQLNDLYMYSFVLIENKKFVGDLKIMNIDEIINIIHNNNTCDMKSLVTEFDDLRLRCVITKLQNAANIQKAEDKYLEINDSSSTEQNIINKWRTEQQKIQNVTDVVMKIIRHIEYKYDKLLWKNDEIKLLINSMNDVKKYSNYLTKQLLSAFKRLNDKEFYTDSEQMLNKEDKNLYDKYSKYIDGSSLSSHLNTISGFSIMPQIKIIHISRTNTMLNIVWQYKHYNKIPNDICNNIKIFVNAKAFSYNLQMQMVNESYVICNNSINNYGYTLDINKVEIKYKLLNPIQMTLNVECTDGQYNTCDENECKLIAWSDWSSWSECDSSCGGGIKQRNRTCVTGNEQDCVNELGSKSVEIESCNTFECEWSDWSNWSKCPVWCGGVKWVDPIWRTKCHFRERQCKNGNNADCLRQLKTIDGTYELEGCNSHSCFNVFCTFLGIFC